MIKTTAIYIAVAALGLTFPFVWMLSFDYIGAWAIPAWIAAVVIGCSLYQWAGGSSTKS